MTRPADPTPARRPSSGHTTEIAMTAPLVAGVCPCGGLGGEDGFCPDHRGAVAFKVPIGADGAVFPAVWWHWPHPEPCPRGDAWVITTPRDADGATAWACPHRRHEPQVPDEHGLAEAAAV